MAYAKIVPRTRDGDGPVLANGTQVLVGEEQLSGVTKIEIVAEANDIWRAVIHCHALPTDIMAEAVIHAPSLWQRIKVKVFGS